MEGIRASRLCSVLGGFPGRRHVGSPAMRSQVPLELCAAMAGKQLPLPVLQNDNLSWIADQFCK